MEMNGVAGPDQDAGEVAVRAFLAGADLVLISHTPARYEAAACALSAAVEEGRIPVERLRSSASRVAACKLRLEPTGEMAVLASPAHQLVVESAARAAVRVLEGAGQLPLGGRVGVMALDGGGHTQAEEVLRRDPFLDAAVRRGAALVTPEEPGRVDALLVGVRRPDQEQLALLRRLARAYPVAVVALREPYALAGLAKATTVAACDDTPAMVGAVLDLTLGRG
jgi:beta-glucosidase-like glycosyl hydrolase